MPVSNQLNAMINSGRLLKAIGEMKVYNKTGTSVRWVNWRESEYQIKVTWNGNCSLHCYLNFFSAAERDAVHEEAFNVHAMAGEKPYLEKGHGRVKLRHDFFTTKVVTVNQLAAIADEMGIQYTVIYKQECIEARPLFQTLGIPLVPGEMGKELINGVMKSYSCDVFKCL